MKHSRRLVASAMAFGLGLALWGCSTDSLGGTPDPVIPPNNAVGTVTPLFDPTSATRVPLPNDILRNPNPGPSQGLVDQLPNVPPFNQEPFLALKSMRGFSTTGNIMIPFSGQISQASVTPQTVMLIEGAASNVTNSAGTNATIDCNLTVVNPEGTTGGNSTIILQPIRPLKPFTNYFVVVTQDIRSNGVGIGTPAVGVATKSRDPLVLPGGGGNQIFPVPDTNAASLEALRQFYQPLWERAESITGKDRSQIPLVFRFGTQPLFLPLVGLRAQAAADNRPLLGAVTVAGNATAVDTFYTNTPGLNATVPHANIGRIVNGVMSTRNYISNTTGFFQGSGLSALDPIVPQSDKPKNFLVCLPTVANITDPPPVVIFQHGITRSKSDIFVLADSFCAQGFAVVATDLVLHGDDTLPGQTSGTGFINLTNLRNSRDNIRQSAVNLFYLTQLIRSGNTNFDGVGGPDLATGVPGYIGMSLGGIVGGVYTAVDPSSRNTVLNVPGGRISTLLLTSGSFSPAILAGLAGVGIQPNTDGFRQFFLIAQTVVDDADPMNYAAPALAGTLKGGAGNGSRVLVQEAMADTTIDNSATTDLVNAFSLVPGFSLVRPIATALTLLPQVDAPFTNGGLGASGMFQFPGARHGFLLDPTLGNTAACRLQAITYLKTAILTVPTIINPFLVFPRADDTTGGIPYEDTAARAVTF